MKLFAFEEDEVVEVQDEMVDAGVEEQAQEVAEMQEEAAEVDQNVEAVEEGEAAADQLGEVQEVVAATVEQGEGLDPVAAESIRIAVGAICARIGAPTKQMYPLYATENFQSKASRLANSKLAMEGISDTLKAIWAKIKEQIMKLVAKIRSIWDKIWNNMDRTVKAVKAMAKKVDGLEGTVKDVAGHPAPSALVKTVIASEIDAKSMETAIEQFTKASQFLGGTLADNGVKGDLSEVMSLPFGKKLTVKALKAEGSDAVKIDVAIGDAGMEMPQSATVSVLTKAEMKSLLSSVQAMLAEAMKTSDRVNALKATVAKMEAEMEKQIAAAGKSEEADAKKEALKKMSEDRAKIINSIKAVSPSFNVMAVRLARAAMVYVKFSMGKHKKA